jgi:hypothetical protein
MNYAVWVKTSRKLACSRSADFASVTANMYITFVWIWELSDFVYTSPLIVAGPRQGSGSNWNIESSRNR